MAGDRDSEGSERERGSRVGVVGESDSDGAVLSDSDDALRACETFKEE